MVVVTLIGFCFNLWQTATAPQATVFLPFIRAWELAAGAILVLLPRPTTMPRWLCEAIPTLGLGLILAATLRTTQAGAFPGWNALPPVLGAALVLYGGGPPRLAPVQMLAYYTAVVMGKDVYQPRNLAKSVTVE